MAQTTTRLTSDEIKMLGDLAAGSPRYAFGLSKGVRYNIGGARTSAYPGAAPESEPSVHKRSRSSYEGQASEPFTLEKCAGKYGMHPWELVIGQSDVMLSQNAGSSTSWEVPLGLANHASAPRLQDTLRQFTIALDDAPWDVLAPIRHIPIDALPNVFWSATEILPAVAELVPPGSGNVPCISSRMTNGSTRLELRGICNYIGDGFLATSFGSLHYLATLAGIAASFTAASQLTCALAIANNDRDNVRRLIATGEYSRPTWTDHLSREINTFGRLQIAANNSVPLLWEALYERAKRLGARPSSDYALMMSRRTFSIVTTQNPAATTYAIAGPQGPGRLVPSIMSKETMYGKTVYVIDDFVMPGNRRFNPLSDIIEFSEFHLVSSPTDKNNSPIEILIGNRFHKISFGDLEKVAGRALEGGGYLLWRTMRCHGHDIELLPVANAAIRLFQSGPACITNEKATMTHGVTALARTGCAIPNPKEIVSAIMPATMELLSGKESTLFGATRSLPEGKPYDPNTFNDDGIVVIPLDAANFDRAMKKDEIAVDHANKNLLKRFVEPADVDVDLLEYISAQYLRVIARFQNVQDDAAARAAADKLHADPESPRTATDNFNTFNIPVSLVGRLGTSRRMEANGKYKMTYGCGHFNYDMTYEGCEAARNGGVYRVNPPRGEIIL